MDSQAFREAVAGEVRVSPDLVAQAATYVADVVSGEIESSRLIRQFQASMDAAPVQEYAWEEGSGDERAAVVSAARSVTVGLAACEALWQLLNRGVLVPVGSQTDQYAAQFGVRGRRGGSGWSSGITVPVPSISFPARVALAPSMIAASDRILATPDLYLRALDVPSLHALTRVALADAVECFRSDLYTPAAVMLGSAAETAWNDLGSRLAGFADPKLQGMLVSDRTSFATRVDASLAVYERGNGSVPGWTRDRMAHLRDAALWTEQVRDSRNVLHPGWNPATPNTREKLTMLLYGATPALRAIHAIVDDLTATESALEATD